MLVLAAAFGVADAFFTPASVGLMPFVVAPGQLQQANALRGLAYSISGIAGPAVGGLIVAVLSPGWALELDALTFLASAASLALLRIPAASGRAAAGSVAAELRAGFEEVRRRRWLWVTIAFWGAFNLTAFPALRVLGPDVAKRSLGGASAWALILSLGGVGSLLGGLGALRWRPARPLLACILATVLWWPPLLALARPAPLALIAATSLLAAVGMGYGNALWPTILQQQIPAAAISRVSAFDYMGTYVVSPLGYALVGLVAAGVGVGATLIGAALTGMLATAAVLSVASVRRLDSAEPRPAGAGAAPATEAERR